MATLSQDVSLKTPTLTLTLNPSPDHGHALPGRAPHSRPPPTAHRPPPSHARLLPQTRADMGIGSLLWRRGLPLSPQDPQAFAYLGCGKRAPAPTSSAPVGLPRAGDHTQTQTYTRARALSLSLSLLLCLPTHSVHTPPYCVRGSNVTTVHMDLQAVFCAWRKPSTHWSTALRASLRRLRTWLYSSLISAQWSHYSPWRECRRDCTSARSSAAPAKLMRSEVDAARRPGDQRRGPHVCECRAAQSQAHTGEAQELSCGAPKTNFWHARLPPSWPRA